MDETATLNTNGSGVKEGGEEEEQVTQLVNEENAEYPHAKPQPAEAHQASPYTLEEDEFIVACRKGYEGKTGRSIVICFDGTGDSFDKNNTNVVKLFAALKKGDPDQQVYYQPGIGTIDENGKRSIGLHSLVDMMFGTSVNDHIMGGYRFLMQRYKIDDRVCIFGFSRGAYTARALAAMVNTVGVLPAYNIEQVDTAFRIYKQAVKGTENHIMAHEFKRTFSTDVQVHFVGVWDTVSSVGLIPRDLPGTKADHDIRYFRHGLALDEHRGKFQQRNWVARKELKPWKILAPAASRRHADRKPGASAMTERNDAPQVLEVWFAGCHSDVGGGSTYNGVRHSLNRIPLRWMIRQCFICDTGVIFSKQELLELGFNNPDRLVESHLKAEPHDKILEHIEKAEKVQNLITVPLEHRYIKENLVKYIHVPNVVGTPDELVDLVDAMTPVNDQIKAYNFWWLLEVWPIERKISLFGRKFKIYVPHLGRPRRTYEPQPSFHWTVAARERIRGLGYKNAVILGSKKAQQKGWSVYN